MRTIQVELFFSVSEKKGNHFELIKQREIRMFTCDSINLNLQHFTIFNESVFIQIFDLTCPHLKYRACGTTMR